MSMTLFCVGIGLWVACFMGAFRVIEWTRPITVAFLIAIGVGLVLCSATLLGAL